jgi:hypothetical protein
MQRSTTTDPTTTTGARSSGRRRTGLVAAALLLSLVAAACQGPAHEWVPDFNGDGAITEDEISRQRQAITAEFVAAVEAQRRQVQAHPFLTCVRRQESDRAGAYPYAGGYGIANPYSSASGAYQFIDSTWRNVSAKAGHPGYSRAMFAPWYVQDAVALWLVNNGGRSAWNGTGC